ncbi:MAG TPA: SURF1 family protein [Usitatibacter sp.]|nr:SURF1 family protein [Usitatibacter sp.]
MALTVSLGRWQAHRAQEKEARQALYEARMAEPAVRLTGATGPADTLLFRHVRATGRWIADRQVYVDNRVHLGRAGFEVVTPLEIAGTKEAVLVNRGWIARTGAYPRPPRVPVPRGEVEVTGLATVPPAHFLELSSDVIEGSVFQNLSIERYRAWSGLPVLPVVILADPPGGGLAAVAERPDAGVAMHRQYEFTWFLLAATAAALWLGLNLRRAR